MHQVFYIFFICLFRLDLFVKKQKTKSPSDVLDGLFSPNRATWRRREKNKCSIKLKSGQSARECSVDPLALSWWLPARDDGIISSEGSPRRCFSFFSFMFFKGNNMVDFRDGCSCPSQNSHQHLRAAATYFSRATKSESHDLTSQSSLQHLLDFGGLNEKHIALVFSFTLVPYFCLRVIENNLDSVQFACITSESLFETCFETV